MDTIAGLLASLMEVVRTTVACECVYVRAMVIKALIWMQNPHESFEELKSIIACELSDPAWPSSLLNDVLLTLHARFKVLDPFQRVYYILCFDLILSKLFIFPILLCYYLLFVSNHIWGQKQVLTVLYWHWVFAYWRIITLLFFLKKRHYHF